MAETFLAIYENGVLRPLQPVNFREGQTLNLILTLVETEEEMKVEPTSEEQSHPLTEKPEQNEAS